MYKVSVLSPIEASIPKKHFQKYGIGLELDVKVLNPNELDSVKDELRESYVIIGDVSQRVSFKGEVIELMQNTRFFQQPAAYLDNVDVHALKQRGVEVAYLPFINSIPIAEHTIALALVLLRRIIYAHMNAIEGRQVTQDLENLSSELYHKTWGIIGPKYIVKELQKRLKSLGVKVVYNTGSKDALPESKSIEEIFMESDVVSLHDDIYSNRIIGEEELRIMKPTSILIDISRQKVVDQQMLAKAVLEGQIAGAGVDLIGDQQISNPLLLAAKEGAPIVLTPNIASLSNESTLRAIKESIQNVCIYLRGKEPKYII